MTARWIVGPAAILALVALAWSQQPSQPRRAAGSSPGQADPAAIRRTAEAFDAAYNAHDAEAVSRLFTEQAELADDDGLVQGRDAIRAAFADVFTESPEASIRTEVDAVRFPFPSIAIEEGRTFVARDPGGSEVERNYLAIHARNNEGWRIAGVREGSPIAGPTPAEALADLDWLVGDWVDESDDSTVETSCRWSDDGNWLLQDYVVRLVGGPEMTGTQRIGWDAARRQVRSWSFDSEGGHLEAAWTFDGERWTAQVNGVAADGATGSGTRVLTPLGLDAYLLESFHRVLDGEPLPDSEVTVVRRPPEGDAGQISDASADPTDADPANPSN
jgi:uncharacterized protein (TIGR02246 family)